MVVGLLPPPLLAEATRGGAALDVLRWLHKLRLQLQRADDAQLKAVGDELLPQLHTLVTAPSGEAVRRRTAEAMGMYFTVGSTLRLSNTVGQLLDILRSKDDAGKLAAAQCIAELCKAVGRSMASFANDAMAALLKMAKNSDGLMRATALQAVAVTVSKLGNLLSQAHKEIYRTAKATLTDKYLPARVAAAAVLKSICGESNLIPTTDFDACLVAMAKGFEGSDLDTRLALAEVFALVCVSALADATWQSVKSAKRQSRADVMSLFRGLLVRSSGTNDARVGVAEALVYFFQAMGGTWVEKHCSELVQAVVTVLEIPKAFSSAADALCLRRCIHFVVADAMGRRQGQQGRLDTLNALLALTARHVGSGEAQQGQAEGTTQMLLACLEISAELVVILGNACASIYATMLPIVLDASVHSSVDVRLAAALCLRNLVEVVPARAANVISQCLTRLNALRASQISVHGTGACLAATLAASVPSSLGLPQELCERCFTVAFEMIKTDSGTADKQQDLSHVFVATGWTLLSALVGMGASTVSPHLSKIVEAWRAAVALPEEDKSSKVAASRWLRKLKEVYGAMTSMQMFLRFCPDLITEDAQKTVTQLLLQVLDMLPKIPAASKGTAQLAEPAACMRARLFATLTMLPVSLLEEKFPALLPFLVADFALSDNAASNTTTSLLRSQCHEEDSVLLGTSAKSDYDLIENQLVAPQGGGRQGELCNDILYLLRPDVNLQTPLPLPPFIDVVDKAILLFGKVFPFLGSYKHRQQLLEHFIEVIKAAKNPQRKQAVQINIFTAFLCALKATAQIKGSLGKDKVVDVGSQLVMSVLTNEDVILRCAAAEALGRMAQVVGGNFAQSMIQHCVTALQKERNVVGRTAYSLALGCIHRYVGGMDASKHLQSTVGVLHALAQDKADAVKTWALHAIMLTVDSAGQAFDPYAKATRDLCCQVLFDDGSPEAHRCAGNVIDALITTLGPELQLRDLERETYHFILLDAETSPWPSVQLTSLHGMQQLILFAPTKVRVPEFMPVLKSHLTSPHLLLRKAATAILLQLAHRQPEEVHASGDGVEKLLFRMLDGEDDPKLQRDVRECISTLLGALAAAKPSHWLVLCNQVLSGESEKESQATATAEETQAASVAAAKSRGSQSEAAGGEDEEEEEGGDSSRVKVAVAVRTVLPTRWQTKVFAVACVRHIIQVCCEQRATDNPHTNVAAARRHPHGDFLVLRLSEIIRTCFIAATSTVDQLRQVGLEALEAVITTFATTRDLDIDGNHSILEQFQAQVISALRPAFADEVSPLVRFTACKVCASWIASGVNKDKVDLQRLLGLLQKALDALQRGPDASYNERATTMLYLGVLESWAIMLIRAEEGGESMAYLQRALQPMLPRLETMWMDALRDFALVSLPPEYATQVPEQGAFYSRGTRATVRGYYEEAFPQLLRAVAIRADLTAASAASTTFLLLGLCISALTTTQQPQLTVSLLASLRLVVSKTDALANEPALLNEVLAVLGHVLRTQGLTGSTSSAVARGVMCVLQDIVAHPKENARLKCTVADVAVGGPGFAVLECVTVVAVAAVPDILPGYAGKGGAGSGSSAASLLEERVESLSTAAGVLAGLLESCEAEAHATVAPIVLLLLLGLVAAPNTQLTAAATRALQQAVATTKDATSLRSAAVHTIEQLQKALAPGYIGTASTAGLLMALVVLMGNPSCAEDDGLLVSCAGVLKSCLAADTALQSKAVSVAVRLCTGATKQTLTSELAQPILERLARAVTEPPKSAEEATALKFSVVFCEILLAATTSDKQDAMMAIVMPLLVALLNETSSDANVLTVHNAALDTLNKIGPLHPSAFRNVIAAAPKLKQRLEAALRARAAAQQQASHQAAGAGVADGGVAAPKIQLRMDFSAFTSSSS